MKISLREAIECFKRALIPAGPNEIILNQALARIYRNLGEHSEAVGYHRRIVEVCQTDGVFSPDPFLFSVG